MTKSFLQHMSAIPAPRDGESAVHFCGSDALQTDTNIELNRYSFLRAKESKECDRIINSTRLRLST